MTSKAPSRAGMGGYYHSRTTFRSEYEWNRKLAFFRERVRQVPLAEDPAIGI
jgi:hypothetical protein